MKDMVENFTGFYNAFFEFSARSAYRIVKEKNTAMDIAQEVFPLIVKVVVSKNIYFFIRAGYQILFCT